MYNVMLTECVGVKDDTHMLSLHTVCVSIYRDSQGQIKL